MSPISIADFKKIELRTAKIIEVKEHPRADRLWVLVIDLGGGQTREIVAGIKEHYSRETLVGRNIVVVANVEPAEIRGVTSSGMLLAAKNGKELTTITTDRELPAGCLVS